MSIQQNEIEYEILDLEGDLEPSSLRIKPPKISEELAMLSGGLFDALPRAEVPLDTFFPQTVEPSYWSRPRSDSIAPVAANVTEEAPPAPKMGPAWYVGMAAAVAVGLGIGALVQRPGAPAPAPATQPVAAVHALPVTVSAPAKVETPAPLNTPSVKSGTAPVSVKSVKKMEPVVAKASEPVVETAPVPAPEKPAPAAIPQGAAPSNASGAIGSAGRSAASCLEAGELRRSMSVSVTFAPSGRATRAVITGGPHRATPVGSCIAQRLRNATVAPFEGEPVTIHTTIHL